MSVAREGLVMQRQNFPVTMIIAGILVPFIEYLLGAGLPVQPFVCIISCCPLPQPHRV